MLKVIGGHHQGEFIASHSLRVGDQKQLPVYPSVPVAMGDITDISSPAPRVEHYMVMAVRVPGAWVDVMFLAPLGWSHQRCLKHLVEEIKPNV